MSIIEQQQLQEKSYAEALRYMDNAEETLKKIIKFVKIIHYGFIYH